MGDRQGGMTIVRAERDRQYEILPVALLRDDRLSFRARGIAARLLTNVDGYRMTAEDLARQSPAAARGEGRDGILTALRELERVGYLIRRRRQTKEGWWITEVTLHSIPQEPTPAQPTPAEPTSVEPNAGQPDVGSAGLNSSSNNIITKNTTTCSPGFLLHFPRDMGEQERVVVVTLFDELGLGEELRQQLVDELAGKMASPQPAINPVAWLRSTAVRAKDGKYTPAFALPVAAARKRRAEAAMAEERKRRAASEVAARNKAEHEDPAAQARRRAFAAELRRVQRC